MVGARPRRESLFDTDPFVPPRWVHLATGDLLELVLSLGPNPAKFALFRRIKDRKRVILDFDAVRPQQDGTINIFAATSMSLRPLTQ